MPVEIANRQRKCVLDMDEIHRRAEDVLQALHMSHAELSIAFVSDRTIRGLNKTFRHKNKPTDVLSFGDGPSDGPTLEGLPVLLGDVVISVETAARQAADRCEELGMEPGEGQYGLLEEISFLLIQTKISGSP